MLSVIHEAPNEKEKIKSGSDNSDDSDYDERNRSCEEVHSDELEGEL